MAFRLFDFIDPAIVETESKKPKAARTPAVWPSEASAERIEKSAGPIVGKCHRASFLRMIGSPVSNQVDPIGAWRWVTGRMIENHLTTLSQASKPNIYVASGVRAFIPELYLPLELDIVVADPQTNQGCVVECKTYYGYMAKQDIEKNGKPKLENLMQVCLYLLEIPTGAELKRHIAEAMAAKKALEAKGITEHRYRVNVNPELLDKMDDGPLSAKLVYISRDECARKEFDITVKEDFDGSRYPVVDGQIWKIFTVESIYERYKTLQNYWFLARREAVRRLEEKGVVKPETLQLVLAHGDSLDREGATLTPEQEALEDSYLESLEREMRALPDSFWPPAEYQWAYPPEKIEKLFLQGEIGKTRYQDWKKRKTGKDRIGDWQCLYCPYKKICVPKQNPNWAYQLYDIDQMSTTESEV